MFFFGGNRFCIVCRTFDTDFKKISIVDSRTRLSVVICTTYGCTKCQTVCCRVVENTQFGGNIWTNQKLPVQCVHPASGIAVDKQWKPVCTSTVSSLRMPPGLALPANSQQQHPQFQMSRQTGSVPPAVTSKEGGWLKSFEPKEEVAYAGRCHGMVPNGNQQDIAGQDSVISNDQYQQQQQQALLLAQVQATLHALQSCPQQPLSTNYASVVGHVPAISQRPPEEGHFGVAYRKPDVPQAAMDAQRSSFVNEKDVLSAATIANATVSSASAQLKQLHQSGDVLQQEQMLDLSKCMINTTHDADASVTMQPFPLPQQAFVQTASGEPFNNHPGPSSRRLLPAGFQDVSHQYVRSAGVPLTVPTDKMQLEQNQLLVHGANLRCPQSAWSGSNPRQSPYSQYYFPSNAPAAEQYGMVGRLTPVMVGPAGDLFCNSVPSQICNVPSPVMFGSKFPRYW